MANADAIYERRFKYVVSVLPPATEYMQRFLEMARKLTPQPNTVAIIAVGSAFGILVAEGAQDHATRLGYQVVYSAKYPPHGRDIAVIPKEVKATNPDVLVASSYFEEAVLIVKQAKQLKFCPKMLALTLGPEFPDFAKSLGKDAVRTAFGTIEPETFWARLPGTTKVRTSRARRERYRSRAGKSSASTPRICARRPRSIGCPAGAGASRGGIRFETRCVRPARRAHLVAVHVYAASTSW
jgi:Periplasmic binding protein